MRERADAWQRERPMEASASASPSTLFEEARSSSPLKCVWMLAGVMDYKLCDRDYECERCPLDRALRERIAEPAGEDHALAGYPFGGEREDHPPEQHSAHERVRIEGGFRFAETLFYHPAHLWARIERRGHVRIGVDDFGQWLLGRVYRVELPDVGARVSAGRPCSGLAYHAGEIALPAPVTGVIRQINEKLWRYPSLLNRDPYGEGWMMILQPERLQEDLQHLLYGEQARAWYAQETARLQQEIRAAWQARGTPPEALTGRTLQDGGVPLSPSERDLTISSAREALIEQLGPAWWRQVVAQFLHPQTGRSQGAPERKTRQRR